MYNEHEADLSRIIKIMEALSLKDNARKLARDFEIAKCESRLEALMMFNVSEERWRACKEMVKNAIEVLREITSIPQF